MAELTSDRNDPRLTHGVDSEPTTQAEVYLVLSEEERAKGFVRPVRDTYRHVGIRPSHPTRDLMPEELERYAGVGYVAYEVYPNDAGRGPLGRFWTKAQLTSGCGSVTTMGEAPSETYARDPKFYGGTFCVACSMHRPVAEFVWDADGQVVGS